MNKLDREQQVVFAVAPEGQGDGSPILLFGISEAAWNYMKDGKTHTFDLTKAGLPLKIIIYGAATHEAAMKVINDHMAKRNVPYADDRGIDFSIKPKG
jgi:hypothetical protein